MTHTLIAWGHNPGQWDVKDVLTGKGRTIKQVCTPYSAVIAGWQQSDTVLDHTHLLTATVNGKRYLGGDIAGSMDTSFRQIADTRLDPASPMYQAFAQMSVQHTGLETRGNGRLPQVVLTSALPIGWINSGNEGAAREALTQHLRLGLAPSVEVVELHIKSEPAAVVLHEMFDDHGRPTVRAERLTRSLTCVADLGGGTVNYATLDGLTMVPGRAHSPAIGSTVALKQIAAYLHSDLKTAERYARQVLAGERNDPSITTIIRTYKEQVLETLREAWKDVLPDTTLFAGGTANWFTPDELRTVKPNAERLKASQMVIATGLFRFAAFKKAKRDAGRL